jgi:hypothetical protein
MNITSGPIEFSAAPAANAFVLAHCICSCSCCRCLCIGPLHMQQQKLPMHSRWPFAYAAAVPVDAFALAHCLYAKAEAADAFALAHCLCKSRSCRCLCIGPLHTQLQHLSTPLHWPMAYEAASAAADFGWAHNLFGSCC